MSVTREDASKKVAIGYRLLSDWLKEKCERWTLKQAKYWKHEKTRIGKLLLVRALDLIGWKDRVNIQHQFQGEVKQHQCILGLQLVEIFSSAQ